MDWQQKLQYRYKTADMVEKLIAINVVVFIIVFLFQTIGYLFQFPTEFLVEWLVLPKNLNEFIFKPWTIITYAFMHNGIWHILSNMLILYFSGKYFLTFFSPKRLLTYYFLGAIAGAVIFVLSYNLFPAFADLGRSYLMGASGAVMAILVGVATKAPNMQIRLMIIGNLKLWWIAAFLVVLDLVQIPFGNPGGHLAHLGGSLLGYIYTTQLAKGTDIGAWFEKLIDALAGLFSRRPKAAPFKNVYRTPHKPASSHSTSKGSTSGNKAEQQKKIDAILDKISKNGYESLTKAEKDFLFNAGKD